MKKTKASVRTEVLDKYGRPVDLKEEGMDVQVEAYRIGGGFDLDIKIKKELKSSTLFYCPNSSHKSSLDHSKFCR